MSKVMSMHNGEDLANGMTNIFKFSRSTPQLLRTQILPKMGKLHRNSHQLMTAQAQVKPSLPPTTEQSSPLDWNPITSFNIHSRHHRCTVAAVCTIYKMHYSNSPKLLRQHLPNLWPLPPRRTRAANAWEHHHLQVPLQATHHPDLELYCCSFTVAESKSWNSFPNNTVGVPIPKGLQQFKKAAHHHLLKEN
ncbi:uncharacterized protein [Heterodontus francisci]|uniref:uncharacterized protein isoform X1 n=1 Tax=Heterodontus francisci TaxID=7792 RepID=UPI00355AD878